MYTLLVENNDETGSVTVVFVYVVCGTVHSHISAELDSCRNSWGWVFAGASLVPRPRECLGMRLCWSTPQACSVREC